MITLNCDHCGKEHKDCMLVDLCEGFVVGPYVANRMITAGHLCPECRDILGQLVYSWVKAKVKESA